MCASEEVPVARPLVKSLDNISPNWLAGFTEGEGCFYVNISKSKLYKIGFVVQLYFQITQHGRDAVLMDNIKNYLNCGFIKIRKNQDCMDFIVTKYSDIENIVVPFFINIHYMG